MSILILGLVTVFATSCGSSDEFVFTSNTNNNPSTTGNLAFEFQRVAAQAPDLVPNETESFRFDFFSTNPPAESSLVFTTTSGFASEIIVEDVPTNVVSVLVTAFDSNNLPLVTLAGDVTVVAGATTRVDLNDSTPVTLDAITVTPEPAALGNGFDVRPFTAELGDLFDQDSLQLIITGSFSNGSTATLPITTTTTAFSGLTIANVTASGVLSFEAVEACGRNETVTATYTLGSFQQSDDFEVQTSCFFAASDEEPIIPVNGEYDFGYVGSFIRSNGISGEIDENAMTFALESPVTGVTIDPNTGILSASGSASPGAEVTVVVTWVDSGTGGTGLTFRSRVFFEVIDS